VGRLAQPVAAINRTAHFFIQLLSGAEHREPIYTLLFPAISGLDLDDSRVWVPEGEAKASPWPQYTRYLLHHNKLKQRQHKIIIVRQAAARFWTPAVPIGQAALAPTCDTTRRWSPPMGGAHDVHPPGAPPPRLSDVDVLQLFRGRLISPFGKKGGLDHWEAPSPAARCTRSGSELDSHGTRRRRFFEGFSPPFSLGQISLLCRAALHCIVAASRRCFVFTRPGAKARVFLLSPLPPSYFTQAPWAASGPASCFHLLLCLRSFSDGVGREGWNGSP
jgi:hypothetical protein